MLKVVICLRIKKKSSFLFSFLSLGKLLYLELNMKLLIFLISVFVLISCIQETDVKRDVLYHVFVTDTDSKQPLSAVEVEFNTQEGESSIITTDSSGRVKSETFHTQSVLILASKTGYGAKDTLDVLEEADSTTTNSTIMRVIRFEMKADSIIEMSSSLMLLSSQALSSEAPMSSLELASSSTESISSSVELP